MKEGVIKRIIKDELRITVSAMELHEFLNMGTRFSD